MDRGKANALVDSILDTHLAALNGDGVTTGRVRDVLENARTDLHGLVNEIFGDFDAAVDQAVDLVRDSAGLDDDDNR